MLSVDRAMNNHNLAMSGKEILKQKAEDKSSSRAVLKVQVQPLLGLDQMRLRSGGGCTSEAGNYGSIFGNLGQRSVK